MYRMIIVDDEPTIADWLYQAIASEFGDELDLYRAYSGTECLNIMEKGSVQIVMTDISMPVFSGLDLLRYLNEFYPSTKKIVLSAYDSFEYAKQAINEKVSSYVLKSDGEEAVFESIRNVMFELRQESETFRMEESLKVASDIRTNYERLDAIRAFVSGESNDNDFNALVNPRWIDFELPMDFVLFSRESDNDSNFLDIALEDSLFAAVKTYFHYELIQMGKHERIALIQAAKTDTKPHLAPSLFAALENIEQRWFGVTKEHLNLIYAPQQIKEDLKKTYDRLHQSILEMEDYNEGLILNENQAELLRQNSVHYDDIRTEIRVVKQFIDTHLDEELSLIQLSEIAYMNPSYLSYIFKTETGQNISDYIKGKRMQACKELLEDPKYQIREIARAVGFENASYFTRFFKKMTGMTPQAYRQQMLK